jgi:hypothetical protein
LQEGEEIRNKGSGFDRNSLSPLWSKVVYHVHTYFTYEGFHGIIFKYHLKLLHDLRHHRLINIPFFVWKILQNMAQSVQNNNDNKRASPTIGLSRLWSCMHSTRPIVHGKSQRNVIHKLCKY